MFATVPYRARATNSIASRSLGKPAAAFPGRVATDSDLMVAVDRQQTRLALPLNSTDTAMTVENPAILSAYNLLTIDSEIVKTTGPAVGNAIPIARGFDGTTPAVHLASTIVSGFVDAWHHNALVAEVEAIENALGANLSKIPSSPLFQIENYNFSPIAGAVALNAGANVITVPTVPAGWAIGNKVYLSGGAGAPEAATLSGITGNQVILTCANAHPLPWSISSASAGIQETEVVAYAAGGGTCILPAGNHTVRATVKMYSGVGIYGYGVYQSVIVRTGDFGDTFFGENVNNIYFARLQMQQTINYVPGTPGTASNLPTHGAHVRLAGVNRARFDDVRFQDMFHGVAINGGVDIHFYECPFVGTWDNRPGSPKATLSHLHVEPYNAAYGVPSFIRLYGCFFGGNLNGTTGSYTNYIKIACQIGIHIQCVEDFQMCGGFIEGSSSINVLLDSTNTTHVLLNVQFLGVRFDACGTQDLVIWGDGTASAADVVIDGCIFNGEIAGKSALYIQNGTTGLASVRGLVFSNNFVWAYYESGLNIADGVGLSICNNVIHGYNINGNVPSSLASGIFIGGRTTGFVLSGNLIGGGLGFEAYNGTGSNCRYGIFVDSYNVVNVGKIAGNTTPSPNSLGTLADLVYTEVVRSSTFANLPPAPMLGSYATVTDASIATWGAAIAGGGSSKVLAFYNGTNWTVAGK